MDVSNIGDFDGNAGGAVLDDDLAEFVGIVHLSADQTEDELMIGFVESRGVEQVGGVDGVNEVGDGDAGEQQFCGVWGDSELRHFAALHDDRADAGEPVEWRLQVVGGDLPKALLRHGVRGEAVAEDGKGGEGEAMGGDLGGGGESLFHLG